MAFQLTRGGTFRPESGTRRIVPPQKVDEWTSDIVNRHIGDLSSHSAREFGLRAFVFLLSDWAVLP